MKLQITVDEHYPVLGLAKVFPDTASEDIKEIPDEFIPRYLAAFGEFVAVQKELHKLFSDENLNNDPMWFDSIRHTLEAINTL